MESFFNKALEPRDLELLVEEIAWLKSIPELIPIDYNRYWEYGKILKFAKEYLEPNSLIVESGGGGSTLSPALVKLGHKVHSTDINQGLLEGGLQKFKGIPGYENLSWDLRSAEHMGFPDDNFDCVMCISVIEHMPDDRPALTELQRITKPGGYLLLSFDFTGHDQPPTHHQARLYNAEGVQAIADHLSQCEPIEPLDYTYDGDHIACYGCPGCVYNGAMIILRKM